MSVPSDYTTGPINTALDISSLQFESPFYELFGGSGFNGIWADIEPLSPSSVGALLGYVHFTLGVRGAQSRSTIYSLPVIPGFAAVYAYPQILSQRQCNVIFLPRPGLLRYTIRTAAIQ